MAKFASNASGAVLLQNAVQVTESISGSVVPLAMFVYCGKNMYDICVAEILKLGIFAFRADVPFCETLHCHGARQWPWYYAVPPLPSKFDFHQKVTF